MTSNPELARFAAFAGEDLTQDELIRAARATAAAGILATSADPFTGLLTGAGLTYADLLKTSQDGRRYELIDGSLLVSPTPSLRHQHVSLGLSRLLMDACGPDLTVGENSDVILDPGTERRTAIPDIYLADADGFWETTQHALPVAHLRLVVEIASPSSVTTDRVLKAEFYAEAGVQHYWRVEFTSDDRHATCVVIAYRLFDGRYREVQRAGAGESFAVREPVELTFDPLTLTARPLTGATTAPVLMRTSTGGVGARRFFTVLSVAVLAVTAACSTEPTESMVGPSSMPTAVSPTTAAVRLLDPADFAAAMTGDRVTINVHVPDEGSLPGTDLAMPFDRITAQAAELPQDRSTPLAVYCMTGHMSAIAGPELTALGYTDVVELRGGMQAWQAAGRPLLPAGG